MKKWHEYHSRNVEEISQPRSDIVSQVRLTLMSMQELLKIVRYSNLFDLNHLMDAIDSINDETRISISNTTTNSSEEDTSVVTNRELFLIREKNYRGRLSKILEFEDNLQSNDFDFI